MILPIPAPFVPSKTNYTTCHLRPLPVNSSGLVGPALVIWKLAAFSLLQGAVLPQAVQWGTKHLYTESEPITHSLRKTFNGSPEWTK